MSLSTSNSDKPRDGAETSSTDHVTTHAGQFRITHRAGDETRELAGQYHLRHARDGLAVHEAGRVTPLVVIETDDVRVEPEAAAGEIFLRAETEAERITVERLDGPVVTREVGTAEPTTLEGEHAARLLRANATSTVAAVDELARTLETDGSAAVERAVVTSAEADTAELRRLIAEVAAACRGGE